MNKYERSNWVKNVKRSCENLKHSCENVSKLIKTVIFFNFLIVLLPLSALYTFYGQSVAIGLTCYILMGLFTILFIYLFTPKKGKVKSRSLESLRFRYKLKKLFQHPRSSLNRSLSVLFFAGFSIVGGIQILILNLIFEGVVLFSIMFILLIIFMPNSPKTKRRDLAEESKFPAISGKNREIRLRRRFQILKNKIKITSDKRKKLKGAWLILSCVVFSTVLGWTIFYITNEDIPDPVFGTVPQEYRRDGIDFSLEDLEYFEDLESVKDITFNSLIVLKFELSLPFPKELTFHAQLAPKDVLVNGSLYEESKLLKKTHEFSSNTFRGSFRDKNVFFKIDLDKSQTPVLPGDYELNVFYTTRNSFLSSSVSPTLSFNITIEKDSVSFNPYYIEDPLRISRRGSIYSLYDKNILGWNNYFETRAENSLGNPIAGNFELYLTQREGNAPVYKKITDFQTENDGIISYKTVTRSHYREYMRGKIVYDGEQDLFLKTTYHYEDCEIAQNKFLHTSTWPDRDEFTYNGTGFDSYNTNEFKITTHLYYHTEFNSQELKWTTSPTFSHDDPLPDFIYLDINDDLTTYIESPVIGYLGTVADYAHFSYNYELYNYGTPSDDIWVDIKSQIYRDEVLVCEQYEFQGYYNTQGSNWQTVNINITDYCTEAGQQFQFKILADFDFDPEYSDDISLRFDWAIVEAFYSPVYYRGFNFADGFNQFSSPTMGSSEALYWDIDNPLALGNDILSSANYPGLIINNLFSQDFRLDTSWEIFSGLFSEGSEPQFDRRDDLNLNPTWMDFNGNGLSVFDLLSVNPPINVSGEFQSVIEDEFTSVDDSDSILAEIRQRFVSPKIISNDKYIFVAFAGRYSQDNQWKIYMTYAVRGTDGEFSTPIRVYDPGDDSIYQLAPSIALSDTDLHLVWQERNRDTHSAGESEWTIKYGRIGLSDFILKDTKNITTYNPSNLDKVAMMSPDIALIPLGNVYDVSGRLIHQECMVHVSFTETTWTNLTPGSRNNEDVNDIKKNILYTQLSSTYFPSSFSTPIIINEYIASDYGASSDIPLQPSDFNLLSGLSDWLGDLQDQDSDYSSFFPDITSTGAEALHFLADFEENVGFSTFGQMQSLEGMLYGDTSWTSGNNGNGYALLFDGDGQLVPSEAFGSTIYATYANVSYEYSSSTLSPQTMASIGDPPNADWINPDNAKIQDGVHAYALMIKKKSSDIFRANNFGFTIPTDATIEGIIVGFDRHADTSDIIEDISVNLVLDGTTYGDNKASTTRWDSSNDDTYTTYGGSTDNWNAGFSYSNINSNTFGVQIDVSNKDTVSSQTAYVDHIQITIYYTPQQESGIVRPDNDVSTQWNASAQIDHYNLLNDTEIDPTPPDTNSDYIFTSSKSQGTSIIDSLDMETINIKNGIVTEITLKIYGNETDINSIINVNCGGWLGSKQLNMGSSPSWNTYTWSGLSLSQTDLDSMYIKIESEIPTGGPPTYENFDFVQFGNILDFPLGTTSGEFMISAWIYPTAFTSNQSTNGIKNCFISKDGNIEIGINESGYMQLFLSTSGGSSLAYYGVSGSIPLDDWTFITIFYNQSDCDVLIDNIWYYSAIGETPEPWSGNLTTGGDFTVGCELSNYSCFTGKLDQISLYNKTIEFFPELNNLTFTTTFNMSNLPSEATFDAIRLLFSYKTNISQQIDINLFNFNTQQYDLINSATHTFFFNGSYEIISNDYYNQNYEVIAKVSGHGSNDFELHLDMFRLNYSWTIDSSENVINFNANLEAPQISYRLCYNTTSVSEISNEIMINFNQTDETRVFEITSISVENDLGQTILLYNSEEDFVKKFGNSSILFDQNKFVLPDDLEFRDIYDPRSYYFSSEVFIQDTFTYQLASFCYDDVSLIKSINDVYYSEELLAVYEIESEAQMLNRNNYSIVGTYGTADLNITFTNALPSDWYFYVKYCLEDYVVPTNFTVGISTIRNELGIIFERYSNNTHRDIVLDVTDDDFQFQDDIFISSGVNDNDISRYADIIYDNNDLLNIIYSSQVNSTFSQLAFKHTAYNSSSGQFDEDQIISDPIDFSDYDYYKMLNPIVNFGFNSTLFLAYETNFKKTGETDKWKIQYMYFDPVTDTTIGPFFIKSSDSSQERNPDSYWSNGLFWTFSVNNSDSWSIEYTSSHRVDLNSFSTLAADFLPRIYNRESFYANMSIYFNIDLSNFANDLLEAEDQIRFIVSLEEGDIQYILLDTDWNSQDLDTWIENNLGTYYPRYLRNYYNLSLSSLTFAEINSTDSRVQNNIYPFELQFPYPINFTENFNLRFNLVKDDWSLNSTADMDRFQLGIDNVDISFEIVPINSTANTFGILTKSDKSSSYATSEFLVSSKVDMDTFTFLSDPNLIMVSDYNLVDLLVDFDAFSLLYNPIQQLQIPPASDLECQLMVMVENDADPDLTIPNEIIYDSFTGYQLVDLNLESYWTKDFGHLYYSLNLENFTIDIYNKDEYFELSLDEKRQLFSTLQSIDVDYDDVYYMFQFKVKTFDLNQYNSQNGINLAFDDIGLSINWHNNSGIQEQDLSISDATNFEKISKEAYLNLISDNDIEIDGSDDLIVLSAFSSGFYPSGSNGNYRYYLPTNQKPIEDMTPADYLNLLNLHIGDCIGYNDTYNGLMVDGQELESTVGLVTPNLYSNETCDYQLRTIIDLYPFFNYQEGTDLDKAFTEFRDELLKLKLEIYNQYNSRILSEYSNTIIRMQDFDINDFNSTINSRGEKYYYMKTPLKIYIYGDDIITSTDYIYLKFTVEFLDTFYISTEKTFRNQWGIFLDSLIFEFIQDDIIPEFVNIAPFDIVSGEVNIQTRAVGQDYEWIAFLYNYKNMGEYDGYDLIANITQFTLQDDHTYCNFTWNTTELVDDSIYELLVVYSNKKGFQGNTSIANITVINSPPDITCQAFSLTNNGYEPIDDLEQVSGTLKLTTTNNDDLPLTQVTYYFHDVLPSTQNKDSWTKIIDLFNPDQFFDYFISVEDIPNGTWYIISEALNGGPSSSWDSFVNRTVIDHFDTALNVDADGTVSSQGSATLTLSSVLENHIDYAKFWAQKQGESNWTLINNATFAPFSAPFINLPWDQTTVFTLLAELKMSYSLFGVCYFNVTKTDITLDLDGPTFSVDDNPNDILYQIQQAAGTWTATSDFTGIINGTLSSNDDLSTFRVEYNYGKGWRYDSTTYNAGDTLQWDIRYIPDGNVSFRIYGYDSYDNSEILDFSFINDQNYFKDLYIENYEFDQIYDIFESFYFKIIPIAQDLEVMNITIGNTVQSMTRVDPLSESLYFWVDVEFDLLDFDFEDQTVDTQILTIRTSDLKSQEITLTIPLTMSLGLNTEVIINDLKIQKDHCHLNGKTETTWWKFNEGNGVIIYDAAGNKDGTLVGVEEWVNGKVGDYALHLDNIMFIASSPDDFEVINGALVQNGNLEFLDNDYSAFITEVTLSNHTTFQPGDFTLTNSSFKLPYGELESIDGNYSIIESTEDIPVPDEFIDSINYIKAISGPGTLENTYTDDSNYKQINAKGTYYGNPIFEWIYEIDVTFNFDPSLAGRDFYLSCDIRGRTGYLEVNGQTKSTGSTIDFDDMLIEDVTSITFYTDPRMGDTFTSKIYYFKLVEAIEATPAELEVQVDMQVDDPVDLIYSHRTNESVYIGLNIWNWTSSSWYEIESVNNYNTFDDDSFALNTHFINSSNHIRIKFSGQPTDPFELQIDRLQLSHLVNILDFNSTITIDSESLDSANLKLHYAYRTNISQPIYFKIWNNDINDWDLINSNPCTSFTVLGYYLNSSYINQNNEVILNVYSSSSDNFSLDIDLLKIQDYSYIEVPTVFSSDQDPFSFVGWIEVASLDDTSALYGEYYTNGYARNYISILSNGAVSFDQYIPIDSAAVSDGGLVELDTWVHLAIVKVNNTITFYKNGVQFGASIPHYETYSGPLPTVAGIGARYYNSRWDHEIFNGTIDDFRFFTSALSKDMIQLLYNNSLGSIQSLQAANYDGIYSPNDKIFDLSSTFMLNASSEYSNLHEIPYYNTRPKIKFTGTYYGNIYEYSFVPNINLQNKQNISAQITRSFTGNQVIKIENIPEGFVEILQLFIDSNVDDTYSTVLEPKDLFYYYSISGDNRTLFIQFDDSFIEHNIYNIKVEFTHSTSMISGYPFILNLDVSDLASDIYTVEITAYDIHNNRIVKTYNGMNVDHSGPVILPLFENGVYLNSSSGTISFDISDPNSVDSVSLYYSQNDIFAENFNYYLEQGIYYGTYDFRGDTDGSNPLGWTVVEQTNTSVDAISDLDGHKKVVELYDNSTTNLCSIQNTFSDQTTGTVEFWFRLSNNTMHFSFRMKDDSSECITILIGNGGKLQWYDTDYRDVMDLNANEWYHFRLDFNGISETFDITVNGQLKNSSCPFRASFVDGLDEIYLPTVGSYSGHYAWVDAFGYSWDTTSHSGLGYQLGWNVNTYDIEPLLSAGFGLYIQNDEYVNIIPAFDNEANVVELYDNSSDLISLDFSLSDLTSGSIEFKWGIDNNSKYSYVKLEEDDTPKIELAIVEGTFRYFEGSWQDTGVIAINNQLYQHKIIFDCFTDTFSWYIDGNVTVQNGGFKNHAQEIDNLVFSSHDSDLEYSVYMGAIKYNVYIDYLCNTVVQNGNIWNFNFNEPFLVGTHTLEMVANDTLGYISTFTDREIFFDDTILGFFPDTLPSGYLFNDSDLIFITNSSGVLFNKSIKSLHIYANSEYVDLGYYYNLPQDLNNIIIDSTRILDGEHYLIFEFVDIADNTYIFNYSIIVDNSPPSIEGMSINNLDFEDEVYFNDEVNLALSLYDISEINSVKLYALKVLGDPAIYQTAGNEKNWSSFIMRRSSSNPNESYYLSPNNLTYSFYDGWYDDTEFVYQNILYWDSWNEGIPFINLSIYDIEEVYSSEGISIPFFFDNVKQEIMFDERYREYLTADLTLKGVKCNLGWNTSFTFNNGQWEITDFNIADFVLQGQNPDWWDNLFGFENDDSQYHVHFDHPQKYTRDRFEFYFEIEDIYGNTITTQVYEGIFDDLRAEGSFGRIVGDNTNGANYWALGKTGDAGNILFGSSEEEYQTIYFTPGYIYNSSSDSYYVKYGFSFLHNIDTIRLYNASNYFLGEMDFDSTLLPHPGYKFELNPRHFTEGFTYIKAEIIDKAQNIYTILQDLFIIKEGGNSLTNTLSFGDVIYYNRDQNYTETPIQFNGYLDNWQEIINNENKNNITVDMSYFDYVDENWVPMGTQTTSDGTFTIDWHVDNNTFYKLLPYQRSYLPINYTYNQQPNTYFYGSYGYFDQTSTLHPFLVDLSGNIYVYSYNESNHQWFINFTIPLGFSLDGKVIANLDLNKDNLTDLVIFNKLSSSDNISFYIFNYNTVTFDFNQTILASDIDLPDPLTGALFREYIFDFSGVEYLSLYVCVSNSASEANYIAKLDFDSSLVMTQKYDGTQLPANRVISALDIIGSNIYIGAVNPTYNFVINSSIFSINKELASDSFTMFEDATKGAILDLSSFNSAIGEVVVAGISMSYYHEDDVILYYVFDTSTDNWYKTTFSLDSEQDSFSNEIYDFQIRSIVKSQEGYLESVLIASSQGLWRTYIKTDVISISPTPVFYAVDTFRVWDLFAYEQTSTTSLIPLTKFPVIEIINLYELDKYFDQ